MADVHEARPRLIKRYANRKLYDTRDSRYVTLQQIADYVRAGQEVTIIDNKSKEDLTNVTLAQIIYEEEKKGDKERRSVRSLRSFIQEGIHEGRERILSSFLDGPIGKLVLREEDDEMGAEDAPEEAVVPTGRPAPDEASPRPGAVPVDGPRMRLLSPKEAFDELQRLADDRVKAILGGAMTHVTQLQSEVKRLQGRIEELEAKLGHLGRKAPVEESPSEETLGDEHPPG